MPPYTDQIHFNDKHGAAAAPDNAVVCRHLVGHGHTDNAQNDQKVIGHLPRFRRQFIQAQNRNSQEK